jgi:hypothetical protein
MPQIAIQPLPLKTAAARLKAKTVVASTLRSAQWSDAPQQIRDASFFSSRVAWANLLNREKSDLVANLERMKKTYAPSATAAGGEMFVSRSSFIRDQRKFLKESGYQLAQGAAASRDVRDITSAARLGMIFDVQTGHAKGFTRRKLDSDNPLFLNAWPAKELVRIDARAKPRDWATIWAEARASIPDPESATESSSGRLAALKTSTIWTAISDFGLPYPPYKFGSGMGDRMLRRSEAIALGIMAASDLVRIPQQETADLSAGLEQKAPEDTNIAEALQQVFGGTAEIVNGVIRFIAARAS